MRGIDYGNGTANVDTSTGIRFGWISWHDLDSDVASDIDNKARDAWYDANPPEDGEEYGDGEGPDGTPTGETVTLEGVTVVTLNDGVFVVASPFIAWDGALCSPCAPGACDLRTCERRHVAVKVRALAGLTPEESETPADVAYDVPADWLYRDR